MKTLEKAGKAVMEFAVDWQDDGVRYRDSLWADPVNLWRDWLPVELVASLQGQKEGETVTVSIAADSFVNRIQKTGWSRYGRTRCIVLKNRQKQSSWSLAGITHRATCME